MSGSFSVKKPERRKASRRKTRTILHLVRFTAIIKALYVNSGGNLVQKKERNLGIELLRIICMMCMIIQHIIGHGWIIQTLHPGTWKYELVVMLNNICIFGTRYSRWQYLRRKIQNKCRTTWRHCSHPHGYKDSARASRRTRLVLRSLRLIS